MLLGSSRDMRDEQCWKAAIPILITLFGIETEVRAEHSSKAPPATNLV